MSTPLRICVISSGADEFRTIHASCADSGHLPAAYFQGRSLRSGGPNLDDAAETTSAILDVLPRGMDLLLPGSVEGLARALESYRPDLVIVFGFAWRLPRSVLDIPRHGVINVHVSMLPKYRGPAPLLWAIRNGDRTGGVTVHRMDEEFDTGNVLAQQDGVPLADDITWSNYCADAMPVTYALLRTALARVVAGNPGDPQEHATASYAGFMEEDFARIRWSDDARAIHDQVRTHRFMRSPEHPVAEVDGARLVVKRTSLEPAEGTRVVCGDGEPLWITESREVTPVP